MKGFFSSFALIAFILTFGAFQITAAPAPVESTDQLEPRAALATIYSSCKNNKQAALTFDDGPYVWLYDISKFIIAAGGKATFFFNGNNWACIYDAAERARVRYAYGKGHQIASHTWSHPDLTKLSSSQITTELSRIEQALQRLIGVQPAFMRPPYGAYNNLVRQIVHSRNQSMILWDLDTGDSEGASVSQSKASYTSALSKNPKNLLALNHETYAGTAEQIVPFAIKLLQSKGYELVTVAECLNLKPYQWTKSPPANSPSWSC